MDIWFFISASVVLIFLLDDLFIDVVSLVLNLGPIKHKIIESPSSSPKKLAIMVANWKEQDVIGPMVRANSRLIQDSNVHLFLGVYPNDFKTKEVVEKLAHAFDQVHCVINSKNGPTYKGQMLDEIISGIHLYENEIGERFDGFVLHDSEDLIDPESIDLYSELLKEYDFIQTPVLSFDLPLNQMIGATYLDEFAESHSKDMLVRERLGAAIPSAGVGTCMRRNLVMYFRQLQGGKLFPHKDLTEDYILGLRAAQFGFKSKFACMMNSSGTDLIATREFFPGDFWSSVRQKSRWTLGISCQGWVRLGWFGNLTQRYFIWRDRKALVAPFVTLNCVVLLLAAVVGTSENSLFLTDLLLKLNLIFIGFRLLLRAHWVSYHYDWKQALMVPLRWPVAIVINTGAGLIATKEFLQQAIFGKEVQWKKTQHRFITTEAVVVTKSAAATGGGA